MLRLVLTARTAVFVFLVLPLQAYGFWQTNNKLLKYAQYIIWQCSQELSCISLILEVKWVLLGFFFLEETVT